MTLEVRSRDAWAAVVIANLHMREDLAEKGKWTCQCRCCAYAEQIIAPRVVRGECRAVRDE